LLLAYVVGWPVVALTSSGWVGLILGSGGFLAAIALVSRLGERWPLLRSRLFCAPLLLAGIAVLVASTRNTPLGNVPVNRLALLVAAAAVIVSLVGLIRNRGGSSLWRRWGLVMVAAVILAGVAIDGFLATDPRRSRRQTGRST
jgi:hypothetical protein